MCHSVRFKGTVRAQAPHQFDHPALGVLSGVTAGGKNFLCRTVGKVFAQAGGAIKINQYPFFKVADGQNAHAARNHDPMETAQTDCRFSDPPTLARHCR